MVVHSTTIKPINVLTIDVEDWPQLAHRKLLGNTIPVSSQVTSETHTILDLLAEYQAQATFFILGNVAEKHPDLIRRIAKEGHEVATHGHSHQRLRSMGPELFRSDLCRSIKILEDTVQTPILGHRAAEFSIDGTADWSYETMAAAGLRYDSSIFPIHHPSYGSPKSPRQPYTVQTNSGDLVEFPLATFRMLGQNFPIAGGGYFRLLPRSWIHRGIDSINRSGYLAILYFHPYELGHEWLDVPVQTSSIRRRLMLSARAYKRNYGRGQSMQEKFVALLSSYSFIPLREVLSLESERSSSELLSESRGSVRSTV